MAVKNYTEKFTEIYEALNAQQKAAVDQIEGPVMVLAGPGTGKTQILAARIANILLQTDVHPENILCLTYTDAGTIAMRKRLQNFIGPDAYRVQIATFHAFCNLVIQENLDYFGYRNLDPISKLEENQFLRQMIDELPKNHVLKRYTGDPYYEIGRLSTLFSVMKKEDWQADYLLQKIEEYCKDLPLREEYTYKKKTKKKEGGYHEAGDIKTDKLNEEFRKMELLKAGVLLFEPFQELLIKNYRYDFSDMILWVLKAFRNDPAMLANYQERFQYILVDEFQDTSGSQNDLLQELISYWDSPNIFAVGDDDQSIYRFQGASIANIELFVKQFGSNLNLITLEENYRSTTPILEAAEALIQNNSQRINHQKHLVASHPDRQINTSEPIIKKYYHAIHESASICERILELKSQGASMSEIAIIYRKHAQADEMVRYFKEQNIEVNTRKRINILQEPLVLKLLTMMRYLVAETKIPHSGESYLFELMHFQEFSLDTQEIAKLSLNIARLNFNERQTNWRAELKTLGQPKKPDLFNQETKPNNFATFIETIEHLIATNLNQTPQETLHTIIRECGLLGTALSANERSWQMEVLQTFFDFVKLECSKKPNHTLATLLETFELMQQDNLELPAEKVWYANNGVNFITAHSAKGLEFDYVFMIGCDSKTWDQSPVNRGYKLPDNLFTLTADEAEEARRLFYVGLTRARKHLELSYCSYELTQRELEPSRFLAELKDKEVIKEIAVDFNQELVMDYMEKAQPKDQGSIPDTIIDNAFTDSLLEKYSLSVTHLNTYLKCPVSFYFNNFIRVPAPKSASMTFGSAIHFALEQLFRKMNAHPSKEFGGIEQVVNDFRWFMKRNRDSFTEIEFKRRMEYGENILPAYYQEYVQGWNKVTSVEKPYRNVVVKGIPLNGKLDKLEFTGNLVDVIDYKTGSYKNAKDKFKRPNPEAVAKAIEKGKEPSFEDQFGGDYWRQAVFYKLLMDYDIQKNWEMQKTIFDFVEPIMSAGEKGKNTYQFHKELVEIYPQDLEIVTEQIKSTFEGIQNKQFKTGCNKEDCHWCNFVKNYYTDQKQKIGLTELEED